MHCKTFGVHVQFAKNLIWSCLSFLNATVYRAPELARLANQNQRVEVLALAKRVRDPKDSS